MGLLLLKSFIAWVVLMLAGINLTGLIIRGILFKIPPIGKDAEFLRREYRQLVWSNAVFTIFAILLTAGYLFVLYRYWGVSLLLCGFAAMFIRIPQLLWEVKVKSQKEIPQTPNLWIYNTTFLLMILLLPAVWWSLK